MRNLPKLLPCPFCGGPAGTYGNEKVYAYCLDQKCIGYTVKEASPRAWNKRPTETFTAEDLRRAWDLGRDQAINAYLTEQIKKA